MRLTYIFAVIVAATLHTSGYALSTTKESNQAVISNVAPSNIVHNIDAAQEDGGRRLRRVGKDDDEELENEIEEERGFKDFGEALKKFIAKQIPFTEAWKDARFNKKAVAVAVDRQRNRDNIKYAST